MGWERARKPEQKAVRRQAILEAARTLFAELEYEEISLNGIAREAGISKPNVYRYFATREEIFLAIFEVEQESFVEALTGRLKRMRAKDVVGAISRAWVEVSLQHATLLELLPQLAISMERNSSVEQLVAFKKTSYRRFEELIEALRRAYPTLTFEEWVTVLQCAFSMMAGLWPLAHPGENVIEAIEHPEVSRSPWDFESLMFSGMSALILGARIPKKG